MLTLAESHELSSIKDEVAKLKQQLKHAKSYKVKHGEIKRLERENAKLKLQLVNAIKSKNTAKDKLEVLRKSLSPKYVTRSDRARIMIKKKWNGELKMTLQQIANSVNLSISTVRTLSANYKKSL